MRYFAPLPGLYFILVSKCAALGLLITDCEPRMRSSINYSINEAVDMVGNATERLSNLQNTLDRGDIQQVRNELAQEEVITLRSWEAMIYAGARGPLNPKNDKFKLARMKLAQTVRTMQVIHNNLVDQVSNRGEEGLQITCDSSWLHPKGSDVYEDWREQIYVSNDAERGQVHVPGGLGAFEKGKTDSLLIFARMAGPYRSVILLNPKTRQKPQSSASGYLLNWSYHKLRELGEQALSKTELKLDDLMPHHLTADLLYAFRSLNLLQDPGGMSKEVIDQHCPSQFNLDHEEYNDYACVMDRANRDPTELVLSPLSFQYLVVALYLKPWDWSLGTNQKHRPSYVNPDRKSASKKKKRPLPDEDIPPVQKKRPSLRQPITTKR